MDESRADAPPGQSRSVPQQLGEFEILRVLGQGGSGVVYRARWGHREVALKVLRENLVATDSERRRFFDEARSLSEIKHPSVVKVLSFGELPDRRPYLAMELLDGRTLADRLAAGPFPVAVALELFDQLVGAVDAMHHSGLVHRDLKPENIVLVSNPARGEEFLVLLDFGIAKELDAQPSTTTQEGGIRGTPAYMAPERFFGQPASQSTDVYELAVTLFVMLVGRLPWDSVADPNGRLDPRRPSELGVHLPGELEAQLLRALSTRPEVRPASAVALAQSVRAAANLPAAPVVRATVPVSGAASSGGAVQTPADRPKALGNASTVHTTRASRKRWLAAGAGALVVALGVTLALVLWPDSTSDDGEQTDNGAAIAATTDESSEEAESDAPDAAPIERRTGDDSILFEAPSYHPSDTLVLIGLRARELRQSDALSRLIDSVKDSPYARVANAYVSDCDMDLFEDIDWITLGVAGKKRDQVDLMIAGNWKRSAIEGCMGNLMSSLDLGEPKNLESAGDVTKLELDSGPVVVGWIDDRTVMVSMRDDATTEWMRDRLDKKGSVADGGELSSAVARLDTRATFWMAGESDAELAAEVLGKVTPPKNLWVSLGISDSISLAGGAEFESDKQVADARKEFDAWSEKVVSAEPVYDMFLRTVKHKPDGDNVLVEAQIDKGLTMLITRGLETELRKSLP